ncbi:PAS domain S-box protein [Labilibacter sediminis]|nr:PAS domain S-box protein [Labilibacter sediminis]
MIKIKTAFILLFSFVIVFLLVILVAFLQLMQNRKEFGKSQINRHYAFVVSDSLRQYSDDLMRNCAAYVLSGDRDILDKYQGLAESFKDTINNSSYFVRPSEFYQFSKNELEYLTKAKDAIEKQKRIEKQAIDEMDYIEENQEEPLLPVNKTNTRSLMVLRGGQYIKVRKDVVENLVVFERLVEDRTQTIYVDNVNQGLKLFYSVLILIIFVIVISCVSFYLIYRRVIYEERLDVNFKAGVVQLEKTQKGLLKSDERFTLAVNNSGAHVWDYNVQSRELVWSPDNSDLLGYKLSDIEPNIDFLLSRIHSDDKAAFEKLFKEHIENNTPFNIDARFYNRYDQVVWLRCKGSSSRDEHNKATRVVGLFVDITDRVKEEEKVMNLILETEDKERSRIAREIHDSLQQTMSTSLLNFEKVRSSITFPDNAIEEKFITGYKYLKESISESRSLAHNLMPKVVDQNGVAVAIESLINAIKGSTSTDLVFYHNFGSTRLTLAVEMTIYRIVQEAVNNMIKYSKADTCSIQLLKSNDLVTLTIEDDGIGFEPQNTNHTFGLNSMKTRTDAIGGYLEVESTPGHGTQILFELTV